MKLIWYKEPWEHFEVENFLSEGELQDVRDYFSTLSVPDGKVGKNKLGRYRHNTYVYPDHPEIHNDICKMLSKKFIRLLRGTSAKWDHNTDEIHIEFDRIYPGFKWPIHNDMWTKRVSFILHISEHGHGTRLYQNADGSGTKRTVNWIPGGGGGFVRSDISHHSFDTLDDNSVRQTVILTSRVKNANTKYNKRTKI
tara:strand:+ start:81 stop:668 length:588 start_codon:yes stop_codon:yes gene_type:complete